jgi:hypothetical protein
MRGGLTPAGRNEACRVATARHARSVLVAIGGIRADKTGPSGPNRDVPTFLGGDISIAPRTPTAAPMERDAGPSIVTRAPVDPVATSFRLLLSYRRNSLLLPKELSSRTESYRGRELSSSHTVLHSTVLPASRSPSPGGVVAVVPTAICGATTRTCETDNPPAASCLAALRRLRLRPSDDARIPPCRRADRTGLRADGESYGRTGGRPANRRTPPSGHRPPSRAACAAPARARPLPPRRRVRHTRADRSDCLSQSGTTGRVPAHEGDVRRQRTGRSRRRPEPDRAAAPCTGLYRGSAENGHGSRLRGRRCHALEELLRQLILRSRRSRRRCR